MTKKKYKPPTPLYSPPMDPHSTIVELMGAEYFIRWHELPRGGSFFIPTTATAKHALKEFQRAADDFDFRLYAVNRCEYGRYGVRIWRTG